MDKEQKEQIQNFLMGEDLLVENVEEKDKKEIDLSTDKSTDEVDLVISPVIIDRKIITENGKILLKD